MDFERNEVAIYFKEREEDYAYLTEMECKDWLDEIVEIAYNADLSYSDRLQKIIDSVQ